MAEINDKSGKRSVINPERFIRSFACGGLSTEQQDAHEFLLSLLNLNFRHISEGVGTAFSGLCSLERERNVPSHYKCFGTRNKFTGILLNELICLPCASKRRPRHISSLKPEPFSCLTFIPSGIPTSDAVYRHFCVPERINDYINYGIDGISCCGRGVVNQKTPLILPQLLFLHISLLGQSTSSSKSSMELQLELSGPGYRYKLISMIVHFGSTGKSGHFVCYRRHYKRKWIECNDSQIKIVKESDMMKEAPYLLLYEKEDNF